MWFRTALYWVLFALGLTGVGCLVAGARFTAGRFLLVLAIVGVTHSIELVWLARRRERA